MMMMMHVGIYELGRRMGKVFGSRFQVSRVNFWERGGLSMNSRRSMKDQ